VPPRFAYWTILIDNMPTAFRARDAQELLPTLTQLRRTNKDVVMKWFARGRLWESHEQERDDFQRRKRARVHAPGSARPNAGQGREERRGKDWRPGGEHKDPRARFDKEKRRRDKHEQRDPRHSHAEWPRPHPQRDSKPRGEKRGPKAERRSKPPRRPGNQAPAHDRRPQARPRGQNELPKPGENKLVTTAQPPPKPGAPVRRPESQPEGLVKKPEPPDHS